MNQRIIDALEIAISVALEENDKYVAGILRSLQGTICMGEQFEDMFSQMTTDFSANMIELIQQNS